MKYTYIKKSLLVLSIASYFLACSPETEINLNESNHTPTGDVVNVTTSQTNYTVSESLIADDSYKIPVTATISKPQNIDAVIYLMKESGNADKSDYNLSEITIPAGDLSGSGYIEILKTGDKESNEVLKVTAKSRDNFKVNFPTVTVNIDNDYKNDNLIFNVTWKGSYTYTPFGGAEVTLDYCAIDFDVLLFTEAGAYVKYIAGTSACVEEGGISGLADGKYLIRVDLYENNLSGLGTNQIIPMKVNYSQDHFIPSTSYDFLQFNTNDSSGLKTIAEVEVVDGYKYTVTPL